MLVDVGFWLLVDVGWPDTRLESPYSGTNSVLNRCDSKKTFKIGVLAFSSGRLTAWASRETVFRGPPAANAGTAARLGPLDFGRLELGGAEACLCASLSAIVLRNREKFVDHPWRQPRGKSVVNLPQMPPPGGGICMGVD